MHKLNNILNRKTLYKSGSFQQVSLTKTLPPQLLGGETRLEKNPYELKNLLHPRVTSVPNRSSFSAQGQLPNVNGVSQTPVDLDNTLVESLQDLGVSAVKKRL